MGRVRRIEGNFETYFEIRQAELDRAGVAQTKMRRTSYRKMVRK